MDFHEKTFLVGPRQTGAEITNPHIFDVILSIGLFHLKSCIRSFHLQHYNIYIRDLQVFWKFLIFFSSLKSYLRPVHKFFSVRCELIHI